MEVSDLVLTVIGVVIIILLAVLLFKWSAGQGGPTAATDANALALLQRAMNDLRGAVDARLSENTQRMDGAVSSAQRLVQEVTTELVAIKEIGARTGKFAEQVQALQDTLSNPKQRGIFGEYILERVLADVLGAGTYEMQYSFKDCRVDAIIRIGPSIVPIDSKFSLDNYNKLAAASETDRPAIERTFVADLKKRIDETAKYIRPEEGTMNFAFMFVPAEGIYYDLLTNRVGADQETNLIRQAAQKKVIIVSPTTLFAYLQTVLQGLKALTIEQRAEEILVRVGELGRHIGAYEECYRLLGRSLGAAVGHYNTGYKELGKIDKDVLNLTDASAGIEVQLIDKPTQE
jgi:DNA recombination protein RmuC